MKNIIKNLETGKIELHFEKSEYLALTDAQKEELKGAFLWSNYGKCWVSRTKEPNTWRAEQIAEKLGFAGVEKVGERLTFAEQLDRQTERAERRADRYEEYAGNAQKRAQSLQAPLNSMRGDIAFFTQPIIAGHAGSRAFARCRERMYAKYERGMDEYRKSGYYIDRAATARTTAANAKLTDAVYLDNRIKECGKNLRDLQARITTIEENIFRLQSGEALRAYNGNPLTIEGQESRLDEIIERYEAEQDKLNFFEDCMSKIGGVQFSQENIKVGYIVGVKHSGKCEIVSAGPVNIKYKILTGGAAGMVLTAAYAEIEKILAEKQVAPVVNPYKDNDILCLHRPADDSIYRAFQVLKATDKSVQIQEIAVVAGVPQAGQFKPNSKPERKGVTKSKYSDFVGAYYDDWQMHKYNNKEVPA
jgi:chaperonin cofactor prefoldin